MLISPYLLVSGRARGQSRSSYIWHTLADGGATARECIGCARNEFEMKVAEHAYELFGLGFLSPYPEPAAKEFMFRCVFVPRFCAHVMEETHGEMHRPRLWLWEHAAYVLAHERLSWELAIRLQCPEPEMQNSRPPARRSDGFKKLDFKALLIPNWFDPHDQLLDYKQLLQRFDSWRDAARLSFLHYHSQYCSDLKTDVELLRSAARVGYFQNKCPLPTSMFALAQARFAGNPEALKMLADNRTAPKAMPFGLENEAAGRGADSLLYNSLACDTWLLEIWPLVTAEKWRLKNLVEIEASKLQGHELVAFRTGFHDGEESAKERVRKLKLHLGVKGGSGENFSRTRLPPLAQLAAHIRSIGEQPEQWFLGQRGVGRWE